LNAELALFLIEESIPIEKAKAIAAEATSVSDIALGIMDALPGALTVAEAKAIAERAPLVVDYGTGRAVPSRNDAPPQVRPRGEPGLLEHDTKQVAHGVYTPVLGPDGLTDNQRAAMARGVGLCPNCQQPKTDHLPGCSRVSANGFEPVDPKAVTKDPLSPAV
jgi:hypothetical protein